MSLHNEIMNIQINDPLFDSRTDREKISYKAGHRDARNAAAKMALKYERALAEAVSGLASLYRYDDRARDTLDNVHKILSEKD